MKSQRATAPVSAEANKSDESHVVEKLLEENDELRRQLQRLGVRQTHLAHRLQRVEDSQIFRFLRWLGGHLLDLPPWLLRVLPLPRFIGGSSTLSYKDWIEQSAMMDLACEPRSLAIHPETLPLVSVLVCKTGDRNQTPALTSLSTQSYSSREVHFSSEESADDFRESLTKCTGSLVAIVSADAALEPDAIQRWVKAASQGVDLVYSDWDYVDAQGKRHSPRFTPEFSPTLLEQSLYWGDCFMVRTEVLRRVLLAEGIEGPSLLHRVALEASRGGHVVRVPRILWHLTGDVRDPLRPGTETNARSVSEPNASPVRSYTASIIICSRTPDRIRKCLTALRPTIHQRVEVIVVSHETSQPNGVPEIAAMFGAKVVPYRGAFHFGFMNALGARAAQGAILVFLNDDVYPIAPDWLDRMAAHAVKSDVGAVGALLLYPSGKIQHAGVVVGGMPGAIHIGRAMKDATYWPWLTASREVTAVTGACMAIRREVWDELGGFDSRFPVNYNDVDLCLRARRAGYRVILETKAVLTHEESQTRQAGARPEEMALFGNLWGDVLERPDPYFHPNLTLLRRDIALRSPWDRLG